MKSLLLNIMNLFSPYHPFVVQDCFDLSNREVYVLWPVGDLLHGDHRTEVNDAVVKSEPILHKKGTFLNLLPVTTEHVLFLAWCLMVWAPRKVEKYSLSSRLIANPAFVT